MSEVARALFGGPDEDYGPCACGQHRATIPVAIPGDWARNQPDEIGKDFPFAMGYDYRRVFGPVSRGDGYFLNFSACPECCAKAASLGLAEEVDNVGFSSNALTEALLGEVAEALSEHGEAT